MKLSIAFFFFVATLVKVEEELWSLFCYKTESDGISSSLYQEESSIMGCTKMFAFSLLVLFIIEILMLGDGVLCNLS